MCILHIGLTPPGSPFPVLHDASAAPPSRSWRPGTATRPMGAPSAAPASPARPMRTRCAFCTSASHHPGAPSPFCATPAQRPRAGARGREPRRDRWEPPPQPRPRLRGRCERDVHFAHRPHTTREPLPRSARRLRTAPEPEPAAANRDETDGSPLRSPGLACAADANAMCILHIGLTPPASPFPVLHDASAPPASPPRLSRADLGAHSGAVRVTRASSTAPLLAGALALLTCSPAAGPARAQPLPPRWPRAPLAEVARMQVGADTAWQRYGVEGRGAVLCLVDTGVDPTHRNLTDASGAPRILWLLDSFGAARGRFANLEARFGGAVWGGDESGLPGDPHGHGTAMASIALGDGSDGEEVGPTAGIAPAASLVVVRAYDPTMGGFTDDAVVNGVRFCRAVASQDEAIDARRMVVLLSLGGHDGAHDGSGAFERALTAEAQAVPIVVAAGNDGARAVHATARLFEGETSSIDVHIPHSLLPDAELALTLRWRGGALSVVGPNGEQSAWMSTPPDAPFPLGGAEVALAPLADAPGLFRLALAARDGALASGTYHLAIRGPMELEVWLAGARLGSTFFPPGLGGIPRPHRRDDHRPGHGRGADRGRLDGGPHRGLHRDRHADHRGRTGAARTLLVDRPRAERRAQAGSGGARRLGAGRPLPRRRGRRPGQPGRRRAGTGSRARRPHRGARDLRVGGGRRRSAAARARAGPERVGGCARPPRGQRKRRRLEPGPRGRRAGRAGAPGSLGELGAGRPHLPRHARAGPDRRDALAGGGRVRRRARGRGRRTAPTGPRSASARRSSRCRCRP